MLKSMVGESACCGTWWFGVASITAMRGDPVWLFGGHKLLLLSLSVILSHFFYMFALIAIVFGFERWFDG